MQVQKIPATVITGFLGAGKTTLIRNLLLNADGKRIALIINEFGDLGVDGGLIEGCGIENCRDEDVIELSNGCICCTVADDFIPTMSRLLDRDELPDHIVIETSGLALPQPLVAAFNWPQIKTRVTVDGVVTVVDSAAGSMGRFAEDEERIAAQRSADESVDHDSPLAELFEDQIIAADLVVLSKGDLLQPGEMDSVRASVSAQVNRRLKIVTAQNGQIPIDVLLGLAAASENEIANRPSHHEREHADGIAHDHDEFDSFVVAPGPVGNPQGFARALSTVIDNHDILRMKGFVDVPGKPMRLVLQAVGNRIEHYYDREWRPDETRTSRLVVIGLHDMDQAAIRDAVSSASG